MITPGTIRTADWKSRALRSRIWSSVTVLTWLPRRVTALPSVMGDATTTTSSRRAAFFSSAAQSAGVCRARMQASSHVHAQFPSIPLPSSLVAICAAGRFARRKPARP